MSMTVAEIRELLRVADQREFAALERSLVADERKGVRQALETARRRLESQAVEDARSESMYTFERSMLETDEGLIVGLDEVGRGAVAGPLAVGAVVLPETPHIAGLNDSKQVKPERRAELADQIRECALAWAVQYVEPADIDRDGMSSSLRRAFAGALEQVQATGVIPDLVLVDGNPLRLDDRERNVVKGDAKCASIAAASLVAKVARDRLMEQLSPAYPEYGFDVNKGYASPQHIAAIEERGLCPLHRKTFCRSFLQASLF